jgi:hypothetical protein
MDIKKKINVNIRSWSGADLPLLMRLMGDPMMTHYLGGPESPEKIRERQKRYCQSSVSGKDPMFVIILEPGMLAAGSIGSVEDDINSDDLHKQK